MDENKKEIWNFLNRELAKLKTVAEISDSLFDNIEIGNNAYNQFFQLVLDAFTREVAVSIYCFFDRRHSWSLYQFPECISEAEIAALEAEANDFIELRHEKVAHLSRKKTVRHNNFSFLSEKGVESLKALIDNIHKLLQKVSVHHQLGSAWALEYPDVKSAYQLLIERLKDTE